MTNVDVQIHHGGIQHSVSPHASIANSTGVLATAYDPKSAGPLIREVRDTDVVKVGGYEMTAAQAASKGLLTKTESGYADPDAPSAASNTNMQKADKAPQADHDQIDTDYLTMDEADQKAIADFVGDLKAHGENPVALVGKIVANPASLDDMITQLAIRTGSPREVTDRLVRDTGWKIEQSISEYVAGKGADPEAFWAWAFRSVDKPLLVAATTSAVFEGRSDGFKTLAEQFVRFRGRR